MNGTELPRYLVEDVASIELIVTLPKNCEADNYYLRLPLLYSMDWNSLVDGLVEAYQSAWEEGLMELDSCRASKSIVNDLSELLCKRSGQIERLQLLFDFFDVRAIHLPGFANAIPLVASKVNLTVLQELRNELYRTAQNFSRGVDSREKLVSKCATAFKNCALPYLQTGSLNHQKQLITSKNEAEIKKIKAHI